MPIAMEEMRGHFAKIRREMRHLHMKLYDGDNLIDKHSKDARH